MHPVSMESCQTGSTGNVSKSRLPHPGAVRYVKSLQICGIGGVNIAPCCLLPACATPCRSSAIKSGDTWLGITCHGGQSYLQADVCAAFEGP
jgi:hypothetical protein